MKLKTFKEIVSDAGYELESYSGRGMYGALCASLRLSVDERPYQVMAKITESALSLKDEWTTKYSATKNVVSSEVDDWLKLMEQTKTDSLGLGIVIYWTCMTWSESDE